MPIQIINPATEEVVREHAEHDQQQVQAVLERAPATFARWRRTPFSERAQLMRQLAKLLRRQQGELARLMTEEMGKPITAAQSEIDKCAWVCDYYAEQAETFLTARQVETDARESLVRYDPLGPVLAIMPWNFPYWQVFRFAAPAVMAGNVFVLKHSSNVAGVALAIEKLFHDVGFPPGVAATLLISSEQASKLIGHASIRAVTLTGSDRAGMAVAQAAGKHLKKTVLELGGSDPFLVLADADPVKAAKEAAKARTINSGQSCIAAKRFIVEEAVAEAFEETFIREMQQLKVGDPMDPDTDLGPLAREDLLNELHDQVERSVASGASKRLGGERLKRRGYFYAPTVLADVTPDMAAFREETFGPVAALCRARDEQHLLELANQTPYGLAAAIFTGDAERGKRLAVDVDAGVVFINGMVKSDPRVPFGGIKRSGYGRELSQEGIREFVNIKTVWLD